MQLLRITQESRNMYGLRHQDYERYRHYCTRKLQRLRKQLDLQQGTKKYHKKEPSEIVDKHLELGLFEAERAWAYCMELKQETQEHPRKQFHAMKRLKKACKHAEKMVEWATGMDPLIVLQVQGYSRLLNAYCYFEQQEWQSAMDLFAESRQIYEQLAKMANGFQEETLCQVVIDEIDPSIRYCAYNLRIKGGQTMNVSELLEMRQRSDNSGLQFLSSQIEEALEKKYKVQESVIDWDFGSVKIKDPKLGEHVLIADEMIALLNPNSKLEEYEQVLGALWEATKWVDHLVKEDQEAVSKVASSKSSENTEALKMAQSYVSHRRLLTTVKRNLLLIETNEKRKPEENIKLCQASERMVSEMTRLFIHETNPDYVKLCDYLQQLLQVYRIVLFAEMYHQRSKIQECGSLSLHAQELINKIQHQGSDQDTQHFVTIFDKIKDKAQQLYCLSVAQSFLSVEQVNQQMESLKIKDEPLFSKMMGFTHVKSPNLVNGPAFVPVLPKPVFFDLAYGHIQYPRQALEAAQKELEPEKKSLFGFSLFS